jgi:hypothetical protein
LEPDSKRSYLRHLHGFSNYMYVSYSYWQLCLCTAAIDTTLYYIKRCQTSEF